MVTGRRLFSGLGDLEALRAVREAQVQRPTEIDPRLPPEIDRILMNALARDPKRRPTAGQFGEQLRGLRYSLEVTVGDPATELGKIIDEAEQVLRESQQMIAQHVGPASGFEHLESSAGEHTVIRIRTADVFSLKDKDGRAMAAVRQVIDKFEEEETRQAQLSGDQLRMLRGSRRDSSELSAPPPPRSDTRSRRPTDEPTTARPPLHSEEVATVAGRGVNVFDGDEATRLVAPTNRRTPVPERVKPPRAATQPPPLPGMTQPRSPPIGELPSTVHQRNPRAHGGSAPPAMPSGPPAMPPGMGNAPPMLADEPQPGTMHQRNPKSGLPPTPMQQPPMQHFPQPPMQQPPMQQPPITLAPTPQPMMAPPQPMLQPPQPMLQPPKPMLPTPLPQHPQQTLLPQPQQNYPMWGAQPQQPMRGPAPMTPDAMQARPSQGPQMAGASPSKKGLQPWMLVVGALVMAALAFAITRAFISG
jgi:hypothetical protein